MKELTKREKKIRRHRRVRAKIKGTIECPRLCVFRSNQHIYAQIIDDEKGKTLFACSDKEIKAKPSTIKTNTDTNEKEKIVKTAQVAIAYEVGKLIAEKMLEKKIKKIVFDRGGYKYHGKIKALAEGARDAGLIF